MARAPSICLPHNYATVNMPLYTRVECVTIVRAALNVGTYIHSSSSQSGREIFDAYFLGGLHFNSQMGSTKLKVFPSCSLEHKSSMLLNQLSLFHVFALFNFSETFFTSLCFSVVNLIPVYVSFCSSQNTNYIWTILQARDISVIVRKLAQQYVERNGEMIHYSILTCSYIFQAWCLWLVLQRLQ